MRSAPTGSCAMSAWASAAGPFASRKSSSLTSLLRASSNRLLRCRRVCVISGCLPSGGLQMIPLFRKMAVMFLNHLEILVAGQLRHRGRRHSPLQGVGYVGVAVGIADDTRE